MTSKSKNTKFKIYNDAETQTDYFQQPIILLPTLSLPFNIFNYNQNNLDSDDKLDPDYNPESDPDYNPESDPENLKINNINKDIVEYCKDEINYYNSLPKKKRKLIDKIEKNIIDINYTKTPIRFKILESDMDIKIKSIAISKINQLDIMDSSSSEYMKLYSWIDNLCKLPIGKYKPLQIDNIQSKNLNQISDFLNNIKNKLDKNVFGHIDTKNQIIQLFAKWIVNPNSKGLVIGIQGPMGCGKCHGIDTPILMYDGSIKKVQHIKINDILMGDDSKPRKVLNLGHGTDKLYRIHQSNGDSYIVNSEHILCLTILDKFIEIPVKEYINLPILNQQLLKGYRSIVEFSNKKIKYDPYYKGKKIGDLNSKNICIPNNYKYNSKFIRTQLLKGILYSDGYLSNGYWKIKLKSKKLTEDILFIARSLGYKTRYIKNCIHIKNTNIDLLSSIHIEYIGIGEYYGFTIDKNHKYLLGDFTVTHNTTLCNSICESLELPHGFIGLGGLSDGSYLLGHSYTYEGSRYGRIAEILMNAKYMNPVMYFDELDKISKSQHGEEIENILIHMIDPSQNNKFSDKYFSDIEIDLSKCLMIFSYNNESLINPILLDRMIKIKTEGYKLKEKITIAKEYTLLNIFKEFNINPNDIIFSDEILTYIINQIDEEQGIRNFKRSLENIVGQINLHKLLKINIFDKVELTFPYIITKKIVDKFIKKKENNIYLDTMYT